MPSLFRRKRLMAVLIGFIVLVALIGFSIRDRDSLTTPEKFFKDTVGWMQSIIHKPVSLVDNSVDNIQNMFEVYEQNQVLKARLSEYKGVIKDNQRLKNDNAELRKTMEKTKSLSDYSPIQATVIARSSDRWFEQMTINRGEEHGVAKDMAVLTSEGMVGKIKSAGAFHSTVQLLSGFDRSNKISSWVVRKDKNEAFGLIEGYDGESGRLLLKGIKLDEELKNGDTVISSGLGGVFPSNLRIGTVEEVVNDHFGLTKTAYVKPFADLFNINHVIVVDRSMQTVENEDQKEDGDS
ncbi:rod shape-determining protein MreC [Halobacillus halophilus]|uniref:Cell shape-determining protein MreC n=1 Tax=Halobacillus halophilus (strain ATCC 35676 / DSM 2266 / JCM 20832 / KCTC 3685 / LMG 17431 / NBRC 102448 / NCIMB 2269) TaxID=866895 RepID=I0JPE0_HALH3|nr:rod shape-determining protein MreC [Halobacillus halophilus]ASF40045.1 rod shape-determining protein MreC [Halobacillus halophilus]CCG46010.1 rod shape-determining protein MreC [Halobacillus halophilus DSM 2266]